MGTKFTFESLLRFLPNARDLQDSLICQFRYDIDDCEVDESDGEEDEVNGNEDGEGGGNEEDSEDGLLRALILYL